MENPVDPKSARRVVLIGRLILLWALVIFGRLVYLQVIKHEDLQKLASAQHHHTVKVESDRGEICDRAGHPLALSIRTKSVAVNPQRVRDPEFFAGLVAPILNLNSAEISAKIRELQGRSGRKAAGRGFLLLARHISPLQADRLRRLPFQNLEILNDFRREYPNGADSAHLVGSLDSEGNGNSGIELKFNSILKGKPGTMRVLTDSLQDRYITWVSNPGQQGANVELTMHNVIQHDAERFLAEGVRESGAESGTAVVMDPQNGEVLAVANYPTFDPLQEVKRPEELAARRNTAVQAPVEPGSVMKMITVTMALDSDQFKPETPIYCENGRFFRPGRGIIHDVHPYGSLDVAHVLIKSSNIGVAKLAISLGPQRLYDYLMKFGMGSKTEIELPGETRGLLRPYKTDKPGVRPWDKYSHEYIAFGHEIGATAMQLARATSVIANGGLLVQPHVVKRIQRALPDGAMETVPLIRKQPERKLRPETAFTVRRIMQQVVLEGTGKRAKIPGYSSGGKTGSAEMYVPGAGWVNKHNSSFIGFAPVTNPRVVVVITLSGTPKQGGIVAAPVFSKVALSALRVLQVPKDLPEDDAPPVELPKEVNELPLKEVAALLPPKPVEGKTQEEDSKPVWDPLVVGPRVPDFRGKPVVAVLRESAALGIPVEIVGRGKAREQKPPPGAILPAGARIQVEFARP